MRWLIWFCVCTCPDGSVVTNDNWKTAQQAEIEASALESALVQTLQPGTYTAVLSGKTDSLGMLVEVYDLDEAADSKLANISTRGFVDVGDNVMIRGLIVGEERRKSSSVRSAHHCNRTASTERSTIRNFRAA